MTRDDDFHVPGTSHDVGGRDRASDRDVSEFLRNPEKVLAAELPRDDPMYWEELAQRIQSAALSQAAKPSRRHASFRATETGWLSASLPLASGFALVAAAAAAFIIGWARPMPNQPDVESVWASAFVPGGLGGAATGETAPSIVALIITSDAVSNAAVGATPRRVP